MAFALASVLALAITLTIASAAAAQEARRQVREARRGNKLRDDAMPPMQVFGLYKRFWERRRGYGRALAAQACCIV